MYASDEVIDTLSVHPLGWKPSFATSPAGYDDEYGASYGAERRYRGFFYTPENGDDPADPRLFDVFLRFLRNQFGGGGGGKVLRIPSVPHGDTEGPSTARRRPFTSPNLADALLKGPAAFFAEIIKTWSTWTHRWHGFGDYGDVTAAPALSSQTGKFGTLARDAERRARRPPSSATRFALDGTIADQAALAVLLWRMRLLDAVVEDREAGLDPNLRLSRLTDAANDRHGGFDPRARSALAVMRREVALMTTEEVDEARGGLIEALNKTLRRIDGVSQPLSALSVDAAVDGGESPSTASLGLQLAAMDGRWEECARWRDVLGAMNAPCVDYTAVFGGETGDKRRRRKGMMIFSKSRGSAQDSSVFLSVDIGITTSLRPRGARNTRRARALTVSGHVGRLLVSIRGHDVPDGARNLSSAPPRRRSAQPRKPFASPMGGRSSQPRDRRSRVVPLRI